MRKILLFTVLAAIALTGCKKGDPVDPPTPPADPYETFKADDTPRWESGTTVERNDEGAWVFVTDAGGSLFDSESYKTGRMSADGSDYELVEFTGPAEAGRPSDGSLRTPSGVAALHSLEIVQATGGKLWIVFKETAGSPERRMVQ
jgi:hypothetical protein